MSNPFLFPLAFDPSIAFLCLASSFLSVCAHLRSSFARGGKR